MLLTLCCCGKSSSTSGDSATVAKNAGQTEDYRLPDTLRVGTLYSPDSYFIYKDEPMGYEYELISRFAEDHGVPVKVEVAPNFNELISRLQRGETDVVAVDVPATAEYKSRVLHCGLPNETHQVLVQRLVNGKPPVTDVTQLPGKDIYVEKDSKYFFRLQNLNDELGGGIHVHSVEQDSIVTEDMLEMVADGRVPFTVIDSDVANFSSRYYSDIDVSLAVGMSQQGSWAVNRDNTGLASLINDWAAQVSTDDVSKKLYRRYYEESKRMPEVSYVAGSVCLRPDGSISPYDALFRQYASKLNWDWRMLAAQAFIECGFDVNQVSWAGARGLMQLMPKTAAAYGCPSDAVTDPEQNLKAAVSCIAALDKSFKGKVPDPAERMKFILAAYNSGVAHILDAIALARKYGMRPDVWDGNVRVALAMKSRPEYYNDPVVKYGYFRANQTIEYVDKVLGTFARYKQLTHS